MAYLIEKDDGGYEEVSKEEFDRFTSANPEYEVSEEPRPEAGWLTTGAGAIEYGLGSLAKAGTGLASFLAKGFSQDKAAGVLDDYYKIANEYQARKKAELNLRPGGPKEFFHTVGSFVPDIAAVLGTAGLYGLPVVAGLVGARTLGEAYGGARERGVPEKKALTSGLIQGAGAGVTSPLMLFPATRMLGPAAKKIIASMAGGALENNLQIPFDLAGQFIETGKVPTKEEVLKLFGNRTLYGGTLGALTSIPGVTTQALLSRQLSKMNEVDRPEIDAVHEKMGAIEAEGATAVEPVAEAIVDNAQPPLLASTEMPARPQVKPGVEASTEVTSKVKPAAQESFPVADTIKENQAIPIPVPKPKKGPTRKYGNTEFVRKNDIWESADGTTQIAKGANGWDVMVGDKVIDTVPKLKDAYKAADEYKTAREESETTQIDPAQQRIATDIENKAAETDAGQANPMNQAAQQRLQPLKSTNGADPTTLVAPTGILDRLRENIKERWADYGSPFSDIGKQVIHNEPPVGGENFMTGKIWGKTVPVASKTQEVWRRIMIYPSTLARNTQHLFNAAGLKVYKAGRRMEDRLFSMTYKLGKTLEPYLIIRDKRRMNAVIAAMRERGAKFAATPTNLAKLGLNPDEIAGVMAYRASMDQSFDMIREHERIMVDHQVTAAKPKYIKKSGEEVDAVANHRDFWQPWTADELGQLGGLEANDINLLLKNQADGQDIKGLIIELRANNRLRDYKNEQLLNVERALGSWRSENYAPFSRYGQFRVVASRPAPAGQEVLPGMARKEVYYFETPRQSRKFIEGIQKKGWVVHDRGPVYKPVKEAYQYMPMDLFRASGISNPDAPTNQAEAGLAPRNWRHHLVEADLVPGYSTDFTRGAADYMVGLASYISARQGGAEMANAIDLIPKNSKLRSYWENYRNYMINPGWEGKGIRKNIAMWFLGMNVKSALVNGTQVLTTTWPLLSRYVKNSPKTLIQAGKLSEKFLKDPTSLLSDPEYSDLAQFLQTSLIQGQFEARQFREMSGRAHGKTIEPGRQTSSDFIMSPFDGMEKLLRIHASTSGYLAGKEMGLAPGLDGPRWQFAKDFNERTMFNYGQSDRPVIQRGWRAPLFIFRNFGGHYYRFIRDNMDPEGFGVVVRSVGSLGTIGGVVAMPLVKEIIKLAENEGLDPKAWLRREMGDNEFTNAVMYGTTSIPKYGGALGPAMAPGDIMPAIDKWTGPARFLGGPAVEVATRGVKAYNALKLKRPDIAIESISPEALRNPLVGLRAIREGGYRDINRIPYLPIDPTVGKLKPEHVVQKLLGVTPPRLARAYETAHSAQLIKQRQKQHMDINTIIAGRVFDDIQNGSKVRIEDLVKLYVDDVKKRPAEEYYEPNVDQIFEELAAILGGLGVSSQFGPKVTRGAIAKLVERDLDWDKRHP